MKISLLKSKVSLRTTRVNIQIIYMVLASRWLFCTDLRKTATFALYIINWFVFINVVENVTARYGLILYIKQITFSL